MLKKIIKTKHNKHIQKNLKILKQYFITYIRCFIAGYTHVNEVPYLLGSKFIVCWQTEYKNMSSIKYLCIRSVLDFA